MKVEGYVFAGTAAFFGAIVALYWFTSYEDAGSTLLLATAAFGMLPGAFLLWAARRSRRRPDASSAATSDGHGPVGAFPVTSFWPLALASGAVLAALGLVFGVWFAIPGAILMVIAATGAVLESRHSG